MKRLIIAVLLFLLAGTAVDAATGVVSFEVKLDPEARTISGTEDITFTPTDPHLYFLLLANLDREPNPYLSPRVIDQSYPHGFEPSTTTIEKVEMVQSGGNTALPFRLISLPPEFQTYSLAETVLALDLPQTGAEVTLRLHFSTVVPRRTGPDQTDNDGVITWRFGWGPLPLLPQSDWSDADGVLKYIGQGSFPLHIPALQYYGRMEVPTGWVLACGADYARLTSSDAGDVYEIENESPTRGIAFALSRDYKRFTLQVSAVTIEVDYLPAHDATARLLATYARDILNEYEERFGPYPRKRLVIVEDPNRDGTSMAADGIVYISSLYFTHRNVTLPGILDRLDEFVLAHEIAHQWWGIGVGVDMNAENWLSEGLAQYSAVSYFEGKYGARGPNFFPEFENGIVEGFIRSQFGFLNMREHQIELPYIMNLERGFDEALVKPLSTVKYGNADAIRIYDKGYLVMREIEDYLGGQERFDSALWAVADRYMHNEMSVDEFKKSIGKHTLTVLDPLFAEWVYGTGTVDYGVEILSRSHTDAGYETKVAVTRDGGIPQPVVISATLRNGKTVKQTWDGKKTHDVVSFTTDAPVARVTIDPDHWLPDRDRLNNNSPIKFVVAAKENAFPLDAYLIVPDPVSQGITISYLDRMRIHIEQDEATAQVAIGRSHSVSLSAQLVNGDLDATATYTYLSFARLETGAAEGYLAPTLAVTIGARRRVAETGVVSYLHFGVDSLPTIARSGEGAVAVDVTPSGAGRIAIGVFDELRILPQIYLRATAIAGTSFGELPHPLLFDRDEIHSFGQAENGILKPLHSYGTQKLYGRIGVELPLEDDSPYNLFNLAMIDHAVMRAFGAIGYTWNGDVEWGKTAPNAEAGVELVFDASAIGGLLPFKALVGYATPLLGEGVDVIYVGFSL